MASHSAIRRSLTFTALCTAMLLGACSSTPTEPEGSPRKETLQVLTQDLQLLTVNAGQPRKVLARQTLKGLPAGEQLVGIDYRVARGVLYTLSRNGQIYTVNTATGQLTPVGTPAVKLDAGPFGFDFNPAADRIRVVSASGANLRLHPDTGALAATDPALAYAPGDTQAGQAPQVVAAGYTYNKKDDKLTTNYAIDRRLGTLVTQGSVEGRSPVVSPNTGQLFTVGALGTGPLQDASLDIADVSGAAFAAVRTTAQPSTRLYLVNLSSGQAQLLGTVGDGAPLIGMAIEP